MNKILFVNAGLHISGVTRVLINLANALSDCGYDVTIKTFTADNDLKHLLNKKVKHELLLPQIAMNGRYMPGYLRLYYNKVNKICKLPAKEQYRRFIRKKYDVEIAFNRGLATRVIAASTNTKSTKLVWVHNDYKLCDNPLAGFSSQGDAVEAYKKFDKIICVSYQAEQAFKEKFGIYENVITRYNVNDEKYMLSSEPAKDIEKKCFTMIAVGRLSKQKNYERMLAMCKKLDDARIIYNLWILGDGEEKQKLLRLKDKWNLDNVFFLGAKTNPYSYFKLADLYICSSDYEGLSTTTIESLIMGVPVVTTDCTGMRDILGDNEWGVITPMTTEGLYEGVKKMISNEDLRNRYVAKCKDRAKNFYSEKTVQEIINLF